MKRLYINGMLIRLFACSDSPEGLVEAPPNQPGRVALAKLEKRYGVTLYDMDQTRRAHIASLDADDYAKLLQALPTEAEHELHNTAARTAFNALPLGARVTLATSLIQGIQRNLNNSSRSCADCSATQWENWTDHQAHLLTAQLTKRLEKLGGLIDIHEKNETT